MRLRPHSQHNSSSPDSPTYLRVVACFNIVLLVIAVLLFWSGISCHVRFESGDFAGGHSRAALHLVFGLIFICLGGGHMWINRWWYRELFTRPGFHHFSTYFLPVYTLLFLFLAITGLFVWLFHMHAIIPAHVICGFVFLGFAALHVAIRAREIWHGLKGRF